ncbi:hypothetical protein CDAR_209521 [Caerostris darwini]|uniref:Uncharacterized protein n=1 Tax=Caerostris darwini TaxID=1538125 RepID=A0AAV4T396_9ARAC|nr:hypothetical protein CDAR_209521 [Caerostris darwini]
MLYCHSATFPHPLHSTVGARAASLFKAKPEKEPNNNKKTKNQREKRFSRQGWRRRSDPRMGFPQRIQSTGLFFFPYSLDSHLFFFLKSPYIFEYEMAGSKDC